MCIEAVVIGSVTIKGSAVQLFLQQCFPALLYDSLVVAYLGCVTCTLEGEQSHSGGRDAIFRLGTVRVFAFQAPQSCTTLIAFQPFKPTFDRSFGKCIATISGQECFFTTFLATV